MLAAEQTHLNKKSVEILPKVRFRAPLKTPFDILLLEKD